jgi:ABC-type histidine transport system ATPase subunit
VAEVLNIVRELSEEGMTMLLASHEMSFAREASSRVCFLDQGVIREQGRPNGSSRLAASERPHRGRPAAVRVIRDCGIARDID